jgi:hypothetical protein
MNDNIRHLHIGGLVAMGLDDRGEYLLAVSHSGSGVYSTKSWERVARETALNYPVNGISIGVGPMHGERIQVVERNEKMDSLQLSALDGSYILLGKSDGIKIIMKDVQQSEIAPTVSETLGPLIGNLDALGYEVVGSQYDHQSFGNFYVDFLGHGREFRVIRDRGQFTIEADKKELARFGLGQAFNDFNEFSAQVLNWLDGPAASETINH